MPDYSIDSIQPIADLAMDDGSRTAGLCNDDQSETGCGVKGQNLSGLQIRVVQSDGKGPTWNGTLPDKEGGAGEWICNLTCSASNQPGPRGMLGDPIDVEVTVTVGTDLNRNAPAATLSLVKVKVGPAPKT